MIHVQERPHTFDDVKGQKYVINNLRNQSIRNRFFNVMILCGKYGSGKTTIARIIALASNCGNKDENGNPCLECESCRSILSQSNADVIEIDGATNNGVEAARKIKEEAGFIPASGRKIIIIDECHKLTSAAWDALLKILEEPPEYMMFLLCTTDEKALPETIRSRAPIYRFGAIEQEILEEKAADAAHKYGISIDDDAMHMLAAYADGSMRNMLSLLEQMSMQSEHITVEDVQTLLGINDYRFTVDFIDNMLKGNLRGCLMQIDDFVGKGRSIRLFSNDMIRCAVDMVIAKNGMTVKGANAEYISRISEVSGRYSDEKVNSLVDAVKSVMEGMRDSADSVDLCGSVVAIYKMLNGSEPKLEADKKLQTICADEPKAQKTAEFKEAAPDGTRKVRTLTTYELPPLPAAIGDIPELPVIKAGDVHEAALPKPELSTEDDETYFSNVDEDDEQMEDIAETEDGSGLKNELPELPKLNMFGIPLPEVSFCNGLMPKIKMEEDDADTDICADEYDDFDEYDEYDYEPDSSRRGAENKKDEKNMLQGLLDKTTDRIKKLLASNSCKEDTDGKCRKVKEPHKPDEENFHRLSDEEKNKRYAWKEYNDLKDGSPLFSESIRQCSLAETDKGIIIGCPNEPIYNILKNLLADSSYLKAEYEP